MLNYAKAVLVRADEVISGDTIDTKCGIADMAWSKVIKIAVDEYRSNQDRIVMTLASDAISNTRTFVGSSMVRVIPNNA